MTTSGNPIEFPKPAWLRDASDELIDALVSDLGGDWPPLYRRYLADEVRHGPRAGLRPAWRAFDRVDQELQRRARTAL